METQLLTLGLSSQYRETRPAPRSLDWPDIEIGRSPGRGHVFPAKRISPFGVRPGLFFALSLAFAPGLCAASTVRGHLETDDLPPYLRDRGNGIALSMFGTYIQKGQWLVYPFFEYYRDSNAEYKPAELGYSEDRDYRGDFEASEELILLAYGVSDRLAIELEAAVIQAELEKEPGDAPELPNEIEESGLGDVEGQLRWRWSAESAQRPEIFSYFETVFPTQDEGSLIGTTDWELKVGSGVSRGFGFGTVTGRVAVEYDAAESEVAVGEMAIEYLRRVSGKFRVFGGVEGSEDEWEAITEVQFHANPRVFFKVNNAFGMTSKAPGWAPEIGVMFAF